MAAGQTIGAAMSVAAYIRVSTAEQNAAILRRILEGAPGPQRDVVIINAAAVLLAGDRVTTLKQGVALAGETIDSSRALAKLKQLIKLTLGLK